MAATKRRIVKLTLDEVSAVDTPAQKGAKVVLIKRLNPTEDKEYTICKGMFYDALDSQLQPNSWGTDETGKSRVTAIIEQITDSNWAFSEAIRDAAKYAVVADKKAAISLIAVEYWTKVDNLLDQITTIISKRMTTMTPEELKTSVAEAVAKAMEGADSASADKVSAAINAAIEPFARASQEATQVASMTADHREYLDTVAKSTNHTDEQKAQLRKEFLDPATTDEARDKVVKTLASSDETFATSDGKVLKRSELGPAYDSLVEQVKKSEDQAKELADLRRGNEERELVAKSRAELPHLPGDDEARVALEKTLGSLDQAAADKVREMLKSSNAAISKSFEQTGMPPAGDSGAADAKLENLAKDLVQKSEGKITYAQAFVKVMESPEGTELYSEHRSTQPSHVS